VLSNRSDTLNSLRVVATMPGGATCEAAYGGDVQVNCEGPSCQLELLTNNDEHYLNIANDGDHNPANGFQAEFAAHTEVEHAGQEARLVIDGDLRPPVIHAAVDGSGVAHFEDVALSEGVRRVQAHCRDANGNITISPAIERTVDLSGCEINVVSV